MLCQDSNLNAIVDTAPAFESQEYGSARARAFSGTHVPMFPNQTRYAGSWDAGGDAAEPLGLEAAIAAAQASAEAKQLTLRNTSSGAIGTSAAGSTMVPKVSPVEEVIDLLSGDDGDASDSGVCGKGLGENGEVSNSARSAGSCHEVVVLDDDPIGDTCSVASPHKGPESSEPKSLSSGPDELKDANASRDVSDPPESAEGGEAAPKPGDNVFKNSNASSDVSVPPKSIDGGGAAAKPCFDVLKDANASPDVSVPPESIDEGETATKPGDDLAGREGGNKITSEPAVALKTGL